MNTNILHTRSLKLCGKKHFLPSLNTLPLGTENGDTYIGKRLETALQLPTNHRSVQAQLWRSAGQGGWEVSESFHDLKVLDAINYLAHIKTDSGMWFARKSKSQHWHIELQKVQLPTLQMISFGKSHAQVNESEYALKSNDVKNRIRSSFMRSKPTLVCWPGVHPSVNRSCWKLI